MLKHPEDWGEDGAYPLGVVAVQPKDQRTISVRRFGCLSATPWCTGYWQKLTRETVQHFRAKGLLT